MEGGEEGDRKSVKKITKMERSYSLDIAKICPSFETNTPAEFVTRRRTIAPSAYSKPKSRLVEPSYKWKLVEGISRMEPISSPSSTSTSSKFKSYTSKENEGTAPVSPKTPQVTSFIEEDDDDDDDDDSNDDDDVYKTGNLQALDGKKQGKKLRLVFMVELIAFVCLMVFLITTLTIPKLRNLLIWSSRLWKWLVLVLVTFCGRLVTDWCCKFLVFLIERNYFMKKKVLYFVYSLKNCIRLLIWLGLTLMAWGLLINRAVRSERDTNIFKHITKALASSLIGVGMWTIKTLLVKILASSFHVNTFFDKIQESVFYLYVIQTLSGPPSMEYTTRMGNSKKSSGMLSIRSVKKGKQGEKEEVIDVEKLHKMKREKVTAWTMGGLVQLVRTSGLYSIYDALDQSVGEERDDRKERKITSEWEAKAAAYKIFKNVAKPGSKYIDEDDLLRFMNMDEVNNVLPLFEGAVHTGKIKKVSFCNWVVNVFNERKYLAHSLNDTKTAIEELNKIVSGIALVIVLIVWLLLMGIATSRVLIIFTSQLLVLGFMFGSTCKSIFEGLVFVFIMHPFDVGDRCVIDGIQMVVEEMKILTTIFLRYDNEKISYPNSVLANKPISNYNRSPEMSECVEFAINISTSPDCVLALKANIKAYLESRPQYWNPNHSMRVKEIEDVNKMIMGLYITHTMNFQNYAEKSNRRSELVFELKKIFEELRIKYHLLPQEICVGRSGSITSAGGRDKRSMSSSSLC